MECSLAPRDLRGAWKVPGGRHMSTTFDPSSASAIMTSSPLPARVDAVRVAAATLAPTPAVGVMPEGAASVHSHSSVSGANVHAISPVAAASVHMGTPVLVASGNTISPTAAAGVRGMSWIDRLTLAAIGVVVVVVTLPVLRGFGLRENELDALRMLRALAAEPAPAAGLAASNRPASLTDLAASDLVLRKRLEDLESLPDGRLRRHGYLFDVLHLAPGEPMLRAWPWEHARTGRGAFVWSPSRGVLGNRNTDGRFSGAGSAPEPEDVAAGGWVPMPRR